MRWKAFIPITIIIAALVAGTILFLDAIVRSALISAGQGIFKARVDIAAVRVSLREASVVVRGLVVADKHDPWKNLFEAGEVEADLLFSQLLRRKVVIQTMAARGVRWGTPREQSGALSEKKKVERKKKQKKQGPGALEKLAAKIQLPDMNALKEKLDVKKLVKPENLSAYKKAEELKIRAEEQSAAWQSAAESFTPDELDRIIAPTKDLSALEVKSVADIPAARAKIAELKEAQSALKEKQQALDSARTRLAADMQVAQDAVSAVDALKDTDVKQILAELNIGDIRVENISEALFGPVITRWVGRIRGAVAFLRTHMPARDPAQKKVEVKRVRARGVDVLFPLAKTYPRFLLQTAELSGATGAVDFSGTVNDVASDPVLHGRPARAALVGGREQAERLSLTATLDHTKGTMNDTGRFDVSGLPLAGKALGGSGYLNRTVARGTGVVNTRFAITDTSWELAFYAAATELALTPADAEGDQAGQIINQVLDGIDTVTVKGSLAEGPDGLAISLKSNLDELIARRIKALFGEKINEARARVRAEVDRLVDAKKQELLARFAEQRQMIETRLKEQEGLLREKTEALTGKVSAGEQRIRGQGKQKVKEEQEKLKEKGKEELKKLFKF